MAQVIPLFEQAVRNVAEANKVRIRYIANIEDEFRKGALKTIGKRKHSLIFRGIV